jgi:hypothetical protein
VRSLPQDDDYLFQNEPNAHTLKWDTLNGVEVYDGFMEIQNCRFAGFEDLDLTTVGQGHGYRWAAAITQVAKQSTWINDPRNVVRNLEWGNDVDRKIYFRPPPSGENQIAFTTIMDEDDSLGYGVDILIFPDVPFLDSHSLATFYPDQGTTGLHGYAVPLKSAAQPLGSQHGQLAMRLHLPGGALPADLKQTSWLRVKDPSGSQPMEGSPWTAESVPTDSDEGGTGVFVFPVTVEVGDSGLSEADVRYYRLSYPLRSASALPTTFDIDFRFAPDVGKVVFLEIPYDLGNGSGGRPSLVEFRNAQNTKVTLTEYSGNTFLGFLTVADAQAFWHVPTPSGKRLFLKLTSLVQDGYSLHPDGAQTGWEITK